MSDYDNQNRTEQGIAIAEHRLVDGINAKAVFPYETPLAVQVDTSTTPGTVYVGQAAMGSATSAPSWQIFAVNTAGPITVKWANGNSAYSNIFDNRASLSYS